MTDSTGGSLAQALWWRLLREGFALVILFPIALGLVFELGLIIPMVSAAGGGSTMPTGGGFHGAPPTFAALGAGSPSVALSLGLAMAPVAIMLACGLAAGMAVSGIMASELNSGSVELWLSRLSPRSISRGLLTVVFLVVGVVWIAIMVVTALVLTVTALALHQEVHVSVAYVVFCVMIPLLLALSGASLAVGVGLWKPKLAQVTNGLVHGQGAWLIMIAFLPSLILGIVVMTGTSAGLSITVAAIIGAGLAVVLAILAVIIGATRLSRDNIVSSL
ncbi:MAG: hypothetical protein LBV06_10215 [Propionibacteriaceae bacterium]|nr:hypothetical protein [Propionibacteriaceae bacterium]